MKIIKLKFSDSSDVNCSICKNEYPVDEGIPDKVIDPYWTCKHCGAGLIKGEKNG